MSSAIPQIVANTAMSGVSAAGTTAGIGGAVALATTILSSNKYLLGLMILLINLGARYIGSELTEFQHKVLNHKFARRILIFLVIWMGTRDIVVALVLTTCFVLLVNVFFNEHSRFCILPKKQSACKITPDEYSLAKQVVDKYEKEHPPMQNPMMLPPGGSPMQFPNSTAQITTNNAQQLVPLQNTRDNNYTHSKTNQTYDQLLFNGQNYSPIIPTTPPPRPIPILH